MLQRCAWKCLVAAAMTLLVAGCHDKQPEKDAQPVRTAIVEMKKPDIEARYAATVLPSAQVEMSFRIGGYVRSIHHIKDVNGGQRELEVGDVVQSGTELAAIRPTDYQARTEFLKSQLSQAQSARVTAQSQLEEATASRDQARLTFDRAKTLFASEAMTKPDYDEARIALDRAEARVKAAMSQLAGQQSHIDEVKASLKEADSALSDTRLIAPFTGVIVARKIEQGSLAGPGTVAFVIANISRVKVAFGVPDVALHRLRLGQKLPVTTESAPGTVFQGRVSSISSSADATSRAYSVEVSVPNESNALKAGMIAAVELKVEGNHPVTEPPAAAVPLSAVVHTAGMDGYGVFVLESREGKTTAQFRAIRLGQVNGRQVTVAYGLVPGEHIVEDGGLQLVSGELVREIR